MANENMTMKQYLDMAHTYARGRSGCTKVTVGSVITDEQGSILAFGANASIPNLCRRQGCLRVTKYGNNAKEHRLPSDCRAVHSEVDAICHLEKSARGGRIYVTRYPCEACARAIVAAGISHVYYGRKQEISEETKAIFKSEDVTVCHVSMWDAEDVIE